MNNNMNAQKWTPIQNHQQQYLPAKPNHPFYYKCHPSNWLFQYFDVEVEKGKKTEVVKKGFFVPHVRMERIVPGANGIHQIDKELGNPSSRIGTLQSQGWTYLDPRKYDYMVVYPVRGGRYHVPKWLQPKAIAGRLITKMDNIAKLKWNVSLLVNGDLPFPETHFWELMIIDYQKRPERFLRDQHIPEVKKKIDADYQIISDMKKALKDFEERGLEVYQEIK